MKKKNPAKKTVKTSKIKKEVYLSIERFFNTGLQQVFYIYDKEADIFYVSFQKPQNATKTIPQKDGSLLRYNKKGELVGITFTNYAKNSKEQKNSPEKLI